MTCTYLCFYALHCWLYSSLYMPLLIAQHDKITRIHFTLFLAIKPNPQHQFPPISSHFRLGECKTASAHNYSGDAAVCEDGRRGRLAGRRNKSDGRCLSVVLVCIACALRLLAFVLRVRLCCFSLRLHCCVLVCWCVMMGGGGGSQAAE
jgi:hypothetical protein